MPHKRLEDITNSFTSSLFEFAGENNNFNEELIYKNYSYWRSTLAAFFRNPTALFTFIVITILLIFTVIQPYLPNQKSPNEIHINPDTNQQLMNQQPCSEFIFGTNVIGQDLWARIWSGTRTSLMIGIFVGLWEAIIGIIVGSIWGYIKELDRIFTEIYNIINNVPTTIVLLLLTYLMEPGVSTLVFAMCITSWVHMARFIRNQIVIIRDREYNLASITLGTPTHRIIIRNLLPYLISVIMLRIALAIPAAIGSEVFLTYIGLGLPNDIPSLGNLVNEGRGVMMYKSLRYQLIFPTIVLSIVTISFYIIGNAFADAADPKNHL